MAGVASFHLVRERPGRFPLALARLGTDRLRLRAVDGLRFRRLLGTGKGSSTAPSADLSRTALFAVWRDEAALDAFLTSSPIARRWASAAETYTVRLRAIGGHGTWRGFDVVADTQAADGGVAHEGPIAVVTRANVKARHWRTFGRAGHPVSDALPAVDGLLAVCGIGEAPIGKQATFSLWRSAAHATAYAYRSPEHAEVVRRTRAEGWYGEELFARFAPFASEGAWDGRDPLRS